MSRWWLGGRKIENLQYRYHAKGRRTGREVRQAGKTPWSPQRALGKKRAWGEKTGTSSEWLQKWKKLQVAVAPLPWITE